MMRLDTALHYSFVAAEFASKALREAIPIRMNGITRFQAESASGNIKTR